MLMPTGGCSSSSSHTAFPTTTTLGAFFNYVETFWSRTNPGLTFVNSFTDVWENLKVSISQNKIFELYLLPPNECTDLKSKFKFQVFLSRQDRKTNSSVCYLGEVMARQFRFEIYWHLHTIDISSTTYKPCIDNVVCECPLSLAPALACSSVVVVVGPKLDNPLYLP